MRPQWRTVLLVVVLALVLLIALLICRGAGEVGAKMFEAAAWALVLMAFAVAGKSGVEALAVGGGVKGAVKVLMTDAKPETPSEKAPERVP